MGGILRNSKSGWWGNLRTNHFCHNHQLEMSQSYLPDWPSTSLMLPRELRTDVASYGI